MIKYLFTSFLQPFNACNNLFSQTKQKEEYYYYTNFTKLSKYFSQAYKKLDVLVQQKHSTLNKKT